MSIPQIQNFKIKIWYCTHHIGYEAQTHVVFTDHHVSL